MKKVRIIKKDDYYYIKTKVLWFWVDGLFCYPSVEMAEKEIKRLYSKDEFIKEIEV